MHDLRHNNTDWTVRALRAALSLAWRPGVAQDAHGIPKIRGVHNPRRNSGSNTLGNLQASLYVVRAGYRYENSTLSTIYLAVSIDYVI